MISWQYLVVGSGGDAQDDAVVDDDREGITGGLVADAVGGAGLEQVVVERPPHAGDRAVAGPCTGMSETTVPAGAAPVSTSRTTHARPRSRATSTSSGENRSEATSSRLASA